MKNIILFVLGIFCLAPARGQLRSELNLPRVGDELVKEQVIFCDASEAGENRTWDFGNVRLTNDAYIVHYFTRNDWKIIGAEKGKLSFLLIDGDSLLTSGYETPVDLVKYRRQGLLLRFPLAYGAASQGQFEGRGKHHDRLESVVSGEIHTTADATGSLILPGNDTLNSVIRVHIRKIDHARYAPISSDFSIDRPADENLFSAVDPEIITTDTYQWYEEGYRYPVFETIETCRGDSIEKIPLSKSAYFYHPAEQAYLPEDTANQVVLERKQAARKAKMLEKESAFLSFGCFPNPVKDHLEIEITLRKAVAVEINISDMHGKLYAHLQLKNHATWYEEKIEMQAYPPGYYIVKISAGNETVSEKILKN